MTDPDEQLEATLRARPLPGLSDEARRRLLADLASVTAEDAESKRHLMAPSLGPSARRTYSLVAVVALSACLLVAFGIWRTWPTKPTPPVARQDPRPQETVVPSASGPKVELVAHWRITPTGKADYRVVEPTRVRLDRGELLVESTEDERLGARDDLQALLRIETPSGEAVAAGTRFYVGSHRPPENEESTMLSPMTRVLVLSGVVTLTTALGSVEGRPGDLLAAEPGQAPTRIAVEANSDFAFDLYKQLAKENRAKNLFFSPYSVSGALAMTAEGARAETAVEMGKVLRFPDAARRVGDDAQWIPWETALMHTGMAELDRKLNGGNDDPARTAEIRERIVELREKLETVKQRMSQLRKDRKWREFSAARREEQQVAAELNGLASQIDQYEIRVANALWGEKTYPFDPEYVKTINRHYDTGGIFPVDFRTAFEDVRLRINGWVEGQTNNRIKDLIPAGALDAYTRLVLANAIYFKGEWSTPFEEDDTKDRDFTLSDGDKTQTPIMHAPKLDVGRYGAFNADGSYFSTPMRIRRGQDPKELYPKADGFAMVELPYKGDDLSMVVIAPNDPAGLPAIEERLTPASLSRWIGQLKKRETHVFLPKFKMETEYTLGDADAPGTLQRMGMVRAFKDPRDPKTGAQFRGMTTSTNPMEQLYISKVFHKAFVEVNEKGTEAAAATAVVMAVKTSMPRDFPFTPEFKADRPFLFLIRERSTGSVLFLGRMVQPTS